jgi:hypothetical protein
MADGWWLVAGGWWLVAGGRVAQLLSFDVSAESLIR